MASIGSDVRSRLSHNVRHLKHPDLLREQSGQPWSYQTCFMFRTSNWGDDACTFTVIKNSNHVNAVRWIAGMYRFQQLVGMWQHNTYHYNVSLKLLLCDVHYVLFFTWITGADASSHNFIYLIPETKPPCLTTSWHDTIPSLNVAISSHYLHLLLVNFRTWRVLINVHTVMYMMCTFVDPPWISTWQSIQCYVNVSWRHQRGRVSQGLNSRFLDPLHVFTLSLTHLYDFNRES